MAKKPAQTATKKTKVGDVEKKGVKKGQNKKTNQGNSKNSKATTKNATKDKKGRK